MSESGGLLFQCIGNRLRHDDGAALVVADRLRELGLGDSVIDYWGEGTRLMADWTRAERVVMVDAAYSGAAPGTIHCIDAASRPVPKGLCYYSTHRFGVAEAVELAKVLGRLPPWLRLYAIEGACFDTGEGLSEPVAAAVTRLVERVCTEIGAIPPGGSGRGGVAEVDADQLKEGRQAGSPGAPGR